MGFLVWFPLIFFVLPYRSSCLWVIDIKAYASHYWMVTLTLLSSKNYFRHIKCNAESTRNKGPGRGFFRVGLSIGPSNFEFLGDDFIFSSASSRIVLPAPSPSCSDAYFAGDARRSRERQAKSRHDLGSWAASSTVSFGSWWRAVVQGEPFQDQFEKIFEEDF